MAHITRLRQCLVGALSPPRALKSIDAAHIAAAGYRCTSTSATQSAPKREQTTPAIGAAAGPIGVEPARGALKAPANKAPTEKCGDPIQDDDDDMVPMLDPSTQEWGGPTKGGVMPEPTRFGDWERKGRCTDFS